MLLRKWAALAAVFGFMLSAGANAQAPFELLNPPQPSEEGKIEVIEFFWYGCPHCYELEPILNAWHKGAPKDVVFKRVPAAHGGWENMARVYYTLEAMGVLESLHGKIFEALHRQNLNLGNKNVRDEWLAKNGVDVAKYNDVEKSFAVMTRVNRAKQMSGTYRIDSVPQLVVNGKYKITGATAGSTVRMMPAVDQAIAAARREKPAAAAAPAPATPAAPAKELVKR